MSFRNCLLPLGLAALLLAVPASAEVPAPAWLARKAAGEAARMVEVPVAKEFIKPGQVIEATDLDFLDLRADRLGRNVVTDPQELIGQAPKRGLAPGVPVRAQEVARPALVAKGALVTMTLSVPNMQLTAAGRAIEAGAAGEVIQVMNLQSRKTVAGTVIGPNQVAVIGSLPR